MTKTCHICRMDITGMEYGVDHWHEPLDKDWRDKVEAEDVVTDVPSEPHMDYVASLIKESRNA